MKPTPEIGTAVRMRDRIAPAMLRPRPVVRWAVYGFTGCLVGSGVVWLVLHTWVRIEGAFGPEHHPVEAWLIRLHGMAAFAALLGLGALWPAHALPGWRQRRQRVSGLALWLGGIVLALGGWALYYVGDDAARRVLSVSHWILGLALPAVLFAHMVGARRAQV